MKKLFIISFILLNLFILVGSVDAARPSSEGLWFTFCETEDNSMLNIATSPGTNVPVCLNIQNASSGDFTVNIEANDGYLSSSREGKVNCGMGTGFGAFVEGFNDSVTVPADSSIEVKGTMQFPPEVAGEALGCMAINKIGDDTGGAAGIVRLARGVRVFIDSNISVGLETISPSNPPLSLPDKSPHEAVYIGIEKGKGKGAIGFENTGSLPQYITGNLQIKDILGNIVLEKRGMTTSVFANDQGQINFDIPQVPWYKMSFEVVFDYTHQAKTEYQSDAITEDMLTEKSKTITTSFFLFPRWIVIVLLALLIIWWIAGKMAKRSKERRKELEELRHYMHDHEEQDAQQSQQQNQQQSEQQQDQQ